MPIPYFDQPTFVLGPITIHSFGALVAVAIVVGAEVVRRRAVTENLDPRKAQQLVGWVLVCGFVVAHLFERLVDHPREWLADPLSILWIWKSLSSFGGFIGAALGIWLYLRRHPLAPHTWRYLDAIAYAFVFAWIFGRAGCFLAFDHPGKPTTFFISQFDKTGVPIFNLGLLEALYFVCLAGLFAALGRTSRPAGFYVALLCLAYAPFRFFADFLRTVDVRHGGMTPAQWGCLVLVGTGILVMRQAFLRRRHPEQANRIAGHRTARG